MAKHPSARRRTNAAASTAREIVLRSPDEPLRPVPELPARRLQQDVEDPDTGKTRKEIVEVEWHDSAKIAWTELWQFPLVYAAPEVDHHLLYVYIALIDDFWRKLEAGRAVTEQANQIRAFSEQWGVGEKSRRHLQITIQEAEEAIERGMTQQRKRVESQVLEDPKPTAELYTPTWSDDDEDSDLVADAEVVE
jgi:hypothetical protein